MQEKIKLSPFTLLLLCCPICKTKLKMLGSTLICLNDECQTSFPIVNGIPVLINERNSIFSIEDFVQGHSAFFDLSPKSKIKKFLYKIIPNIGRNLKARQNYERLTEALLTRSENPKVLILGGSIEGQGMYDMLSISSINFIETDVSFGPRTMAIVDAHDIPFVDSSFDCVVIQAVLEHVVNPYRCVEEIHRVLKTDGLIYAETPFMQQVHGGKYDFTRFTHLGHRRLFRHFEEIDSGAACGTGMALAWSYQYFLLSFVESKFMRRFALIFAKLTSFWWKYFDYYSINKAGTLDAASGYYFLGRKSNRILSDKELLKLYKGAM